MSKFKGGRRYTDRGVSRRALTKGAHEAVRAATEIDKSRQQLVQILLALIVQSDGKIILHRENLMLISEEMQVIVDRDPDNGDYILRAQETDADGTVHVYAQEPREDTASHVDAEG